jgi:hypothetical protein
VHPRWALTREAFGAAAPIVFGWIFASHQLGCVVRGPGGRLARDALGSYDAAWYGGAALCVVGAVLSLSVRRSTGLIVRTQPAAEGAG